MKTNKNDNELGTLSEDEASSSRTKTLNFEEITKNAIEGQVDSQEKLFKLLLTSKEMPSPQISQVLLESFSTHQITTVPKYDYIDMSRRIPVRSKRGNSCDFIIIPGKLWEIDFKNTPSFALLLLALLIHLDFIDFSHECWSVIRNTFQQRKGTLRIHGILTRDWWRSIETTDKYQIIHTIFYEWASYHRSYEQAKKMALTMRLDFLSSPPLSAKDKAEILQELSEIESIYWNVWIQSKLGNNKDCDGKLNQSTLEKLIASSIEADVRSAIESLIRPTVNTPKKVFPKNRRGILDKIVFQLSSNEEDQKYLEAFLKARLNLLYRDRVTDKKKLSDEEKLSAFVSKIKSHPITVKRFQDVLSHIQLKTELLRMGQAARNEEQQGPKKQYQKFEQKQLKKIFKKISKAYFLKPTDYLELHEILQTKVSHHELQLLLYYGHISDPRSNEGALCRSMLVGSLRKDERDDREDKSKYKVDENNDFKKGKGASAGSSLNSQEISVKKTKKGKEKLEDDDNPELEEKINDEDQSSLERDKDALIDSYMEENWPKETAFCAQKIAGFPEFRQLLEKALAGEQEALRGFYPLLILTDSLEMTSPECRHIFLQNITAKMQEKNAYAFIFYALAVHYNFIHPPLNHTQIDALTEGMAKNLKRTIISRKKTKEEQLSIHKALAAAKHYRPELDIEIRAIQSTLLLTALDMENHAKGLNWLLTENDSSDYLFFWALVDQAQGFYDTKSIYWEVWSRMKFVEVEASKQSTRDRLILLIGIKGAFNSEESLETRKLFLNGNIGWLDQGVKQNDPKAMIKRAKIHSNLAGNVQLYRDEIQNFEKLNPFAWKQDCSAAAQLFTRALTQPTLTEEDSISARQELQMLWEYLANAKQLEVVQWEKIIKDLYSIGNKNANKIATYFLREWAQQGDLWAKAHFVIRYSLKKGVKNEDVLNEGIFEKIIKELKATFKIVNNMSNLWRSPTLTTKILQEVDEWCKPKGSAEERLNDVNQLISFLEKYFPEHLKNTTEFKEVYKKMLSVRSNISENASSSVGEEAITMQDNDGNDENTFELQQIKKFA